LARYEAIFFDFDGVLVDSEPVHFACWRDILLEFDLNLEWSLYEQHGIGASDRALLALVCGQTDPPFDLERLVAEYPRKRDMFRDRMLASQPFDAGIPALLAELEVYPKALVTSSGQYEVEPILLHGGVHHHFHATVFGGDVKRHKPAPDPYLLAREKLGVQHGLAVEDSDAGEASARAAGLDVLRIHNFAEMPARLRGALLGV
jgi:beta-phosphoglucomutase